MIALINKLTDGFVRQYQQDTRAAEAALIRALDEPNAWNRPQSDVARQVFRESQSFNEIERFNYINDAVNQLISLNVAKDARSESLIAAIDAALLDTMMAIQSQKTRQGQAMVKRYRDVALRADMIARSTGWSRKSAWFAAKEQMNGSMQLTSLDRAGKRWDTSKYVRAAVRLLLLTVYNETKLYQMAVAGRRSAFVIHVDPTHRYHNLEVGIVPGAEITYSDIKDKIFHPNSNAVIADSKSLVTGLLTPRMVKSAA